VSVEFRLLGDIETRIDGHPVDIGHVRQRCVLVALLVEPGRAVPADQLIEHVWADQLPHNARNALSAYVSRLRRVLAGTDEVRIVRGPGGYALVVDPMAVDLHLFHDLVGQARAAGRDEGAAGLFARALGLWRGEAFATLDTPWINAVRDMVAAQRLLAETERNDVELRLGRHGELLAELPARVQENPLDERLAGQLMLVLYRCGRQSEALVHYEVVRRRLADELGVAPAAPLRELYQRIVTSDPALVTAPQTTEVLEKRADAPSDLQERSTLLAELDAALAAGSGGRGAVVSGEAGIGKSVLVQRFIQRHDGDARFLVGLCDPLLTPRVLGPLRDIAGQVGGPLEKRLATGASREEIFAAFLDELAGYHGPQVIVVEDAQWADEATMDLLTMVGRRLERLRVLLVVTYRDDELDTDHPLRAALSSLPPGSTVRMRPAPLSVAAVAKLAGQAGRPAVGLHAITDGNPLLVTEMLAAGEPGVPATVRDLALVRLAALTSQAQDVVRFVAVNPTRTELWLLKETLRPDVTVVEAAVAGGLLALTGDTIEFRHELIRQAVEESLSSLRHAELNRRALLALTGAPGVDLARLVHHARQAGDVEALLRYAPTVAGQAQRAGAHREAVEHYRVALHHAGRLPDPQRAELLEEYAFSAYSVGLFEEALAARLTALEIWQVAGLAQKVGENCVGCPGCTGGRGSMTRPKRLPPGRSPRWNPVEPAGNWPWRTATRATGICSTANWNRRSSGRSRRSPSPGRWRTRRRSRTR